MKQGYAVALIVVLMATQGGAAAQEDAGQVGTFDEKTRLISVEFKNIDIVEALKFLSAKAGLSIIPTTKCQGRVTLMVEDAPLEDVLEIMLRSNGLACWRQGTIYNIMAEDEYKTLYGKAYGDKRMVRAFQLRYAIPDQALKLVETLKSDIGKVFLNSESGSLTVLDTKENLDEIARVIAMLEDKNMTIKIFDLKYAQAKDIVEGLENRLEFKGIGFIKDDKRTNQVIVQTLSQRMDDIAAIIKELDRKTREVLIDVRIVRLTMSDTLEKGVEWEGLFDVAARYGMTYLGSYPFSAVTGASDAWRSRNTVLKGGTAPDGTVVEGVGYVGAYPFSGTVNSPTAYNSSQPKVGMDGMHVGMVGKHDFDVVFKYLRTIGDVKVVANPKVTVTNNSEARVHIGEKQAYLTETTTQTTSAVTVSEEVTFIDVGIQLHLVPTINEEGYVTIKLKPEISSIVSYLETARGNRIPILNTSTTETTVMVKDASTILIGGLQQESETDESEGVPFFSRIPLLGQVFSSSSKVKTRSELLVMVTPHIVTGDEFTTGYARDFGARLDKEDQEYAPLANEPIALQHKPFREYTLTETLSDQAAVEVEAEKPPPLKPMKHLP